MRFKKPQVRYADTPQPATPYPAARQVWDDRIGTPRVQAKTWRLLAFRCLTLALLMAGGLVWRRSEERRVGKAGVSTCRSRCSPSHEREKHDDTQIIRSPI